MRFLERILMALSTADFFGSLVCILESRNHGLSFMKLSDNVGSMCGEGVKAEGEGLLLCPVIPYNPSG